MLIGVRGIWLIGVRGIHFHPCVSPNSCVCFEPCKALGPLGPCMARWRGSSLGLGPQWAWEKVVPSILCGRLIGVGPPLCIYRPDLVSSMSE